MSSSLGGAGDIVDPPSLSSSQVMTAVVVVEEKNETTQSDVRRSRRVAAAARRRSVAAEPVCVWVPFYTERQMQSMLVPELKSLCRSQSLPVSGNKSNLIQRLQDVIQQTHLPSVVRIQRWVRGHFVRCFVRCKGLRHRRHIVNDTDFNTLDDISTLPFHRYLVLSTPQRPDVHYGFDILSLLQSMRRKSKCGFANPYTREDMSAVLVPHVMRLVTLTTILYGAFDKSARDMVHAVFVVMDFPTYDMNAPAYPPTVYGRMEQVFMHYGWDVAASQVSATSRTSLLFRWNARFFGAPGGGKKTVLDPLSRKRQFSQLSTPSPHRDHDALRGAASSSSSSSTVRLPRPAYLASSSASTEEPSTVSTPWFLRLETDLSLPALRSLISADPIHVDDVRFRFLEVSDAHCLCFPVKRAELARYVQSRMREHSVTPVMYLSFLSDLMKQPRHLRLIWDKTFRSSEAQSFERWGQFLQSNHDDVRRMQRQFEDIMAARTQLTFVQRWMNVCQELDRVGGYYSHPHWFLRRHSGPFDANATIDPLFASSTTTTSSSSLPPLASYGEWRHLERVLSRLLRLLASVPSSRSSFLRVCCVHPFSFLNLGYPSQTEILWHDTRMAADDLREDYSQVAANGHPERVLRVAEYLLFLGFSDEDKSLGASYLVAALTQVDSRIRTWVPWLHDFYNTVVTSSEE